MFRFVLGIILFYLIASIGAWLTYSDYFLKLDLIFLVWASEIPPMSIFLSTVLGFISFLLIGFKSRTFEGGKYGFARFAKRYYIKKFGLNYKNGIILGKAFGKILKTDKPLSLLVLAPPGTGKTAGIIIPTLLTLKNSVLVHDPKGELYDLTSKVRAKFSKVLLYDPMDDNSCVFNPFAKELLPKDKRDVRGYILNMSSILFKPANENSDSYFIDAAKSAFLFFAEWLIWKNQETSLPEIRDKLLETTDIAKTIRVMMSTKGVPDEIKKDGNGVLISEDSDKQWAGVVGTLKETIEIFADPRVKQATSGKMDFCGDDLRKENISLYLKIRDKDAKRLEPLMSMLVESISTQLISSLPNKDDKIVTFVLDEFVRLGKMNIIRDLPSVSRGYKVNTIFVAQDYEQITLKYGREAVSMFDSNCAYKVIFQQNNLQTAEKISKIIGNKTRKKHLLVKAPALKKCKQILLVLAHHHHWKVWL